MRHHFLAIAGLSLIAAPFVAIAQPSPSAATPPDAPHFTLTPEQQTQVDGWPADWKLAYLGWSAPVQQYFWTLDAPQRDAWWRLTDEQRAQVVQLAPAQREAVWASILEQVNGGPDPAAAAPPAPEPPPSDIGPRPEPATDPALCQGEVQDNCINPREAGENWGNRPLEDIPADRDTGGPSSGE